MKPSKPISARLATLLAFVAIVGVWMFPMMYKNPDSEFGYYGKFNRVKHVLEELPGIEIVTSWQHHDITLEDFGFKLRVHGTNTIDIAFYEDRELKTLPRRRAQLKKVVARAIEEKLESVTNR